MASDKARETFMHNALLSMIEKDRPAGECVSEMKILLDFWDNQTPHVEIMPSEVDVYTHLMPRKKAFRKGVVLS